MPPSGLRRGPIALSSCRTPWPSRGSPRPASPAHPAAAAATPARFLSGSHVSYGTALKKLPDQNLLDPADLGGHIRYRETGDLGNRGRILLFEVEQHHLP